MTHAHTSIAILNLLTLMVFIAIILRGRRITYEQATFWFCEAVVVCAFVVGVLR